MVSRNKVLSISIKITIIVRILKILILKPLEL